MLLVDDNRINQKVAIRTLEKMGYRPDLATNGIEALRAVRDNGYDLVLMDVQMPEMDGIEATRRIRVLPLAHQPRSSAMTARRASSAIATSCLEAGMDAFLVKPFRPADVAKTLEACHGRLESAGVPRRPSASSSAAVLDADASGPDVASGQPLAQQRRDAVIGDRHVRAPRRRHADLDRLPVRAHRRGDDRRDPCGEQVRAVLLPRRLGSSVAPPARSFAQ